ncbi:MAG: Gfo/Idh/MocA family oxidoreductase [Verrucomicrobia bacterium]|nr:Gfo/Idh/MocA family oxidoreductase [Verrucomicrobiota bacterium]
MAGKTYRGGVFGFGGMGQEFTTHIHFDRWYGDDVEIVGICNRGADKRKLAEDRYGLKAYEDPADLVAQDLDFAIVTSTTVAHVEHGCLLAEAGVPMLMEKPLALSITEAKKLVDAVEKNNVPSVVNFMYRFLPIHQKMKALCDDGVFGQTLSVEASTYRGVSTYAAGNRHRAVVEPEESGGWIVHHACHMVDLACWFMGEVESVSVDTRSTVPDKFSEEVIHARLRFKNGALGHVFDTVGGTPHRHLAVVGANGGASLTNASGAELLAIRTKGDRETGPPRILDPRDTHAYIDPVKNLLDIVREGGKSFASIQDAYYSIPVTIAMRESARNDGARVVVDA